jgi:hypothetical protein
MHNAKKKIQFYITQWGNIQPWKSIICSDGMHELNRCLQERHKSHFLVPPEVCMIHRFSNEISMMHDTLPQKESETIATKVTCGPFDSD